MNINDETPVNRDAETAIPDGCHENHWLETEHARRCRT